MATILDAICLSKLRTNLLTPLTCVVSYKGFSAFVQYDYTTSSQTEVVFGNDPHTSKFHLS